jgi:hypothetical protein
VAAPHRMNIAPTLVTTADSLRDSYTSADSSLLFWCDVIKGTSIALGIIIFDVHMKLPTCKPTHRLVGVSSHGQPNLSTTPSI